MSLNRKKFACDRTPTIKSITDDFAARVESA